MLRKWGGIGFFLGGIGPDGHVAFNVRGSSNSASMPSFANSAAACLAKVIMRDLFESTGYEVLQVEPARVSKPATLGRVDRMLGGAFTEFIITLPREKGLPK